jgi:trk system potassium uptake protein TrkH
MRNSEAKAYAGIALAATVVVTVLILRQSASFSAAARQAFFHVTSLISTSGFYAADYSLWPFAAQGVLFFLLFIGGCSCSAAGGIKVIRLAILAKQTRNEMRRIVHPRGVFAIVIDGKGADKKVIHGAAGFVFLYFIIIFLTALMVSTTGADVFTSLNTALVCQGNAGLGLGDFAAFKAFPDFPGYVKWTLCLVMIMGRFELWTVLVLFSGDFHRKRRSVNL